MSDEQLNELQQEAKKLVELLESRQTGCTVYDINLHERLSNIHALTTKMLGR